LGSGGLPQKKNQFCAKNYAILSKFWYFFPILQHKVGGLSPSPRSGGPIPLPPPPAPTPMHRSSNESSVVSGSKLHVTHPTSEADRTDARCPSASTVCSDLSPYSAAGGGEGGFRRPRKATSGSPKHQ